MSSLKKCTKPDCDRLSTALYCCGPCRIADAGKYEIHASGSLAHTDRCNERHAERTKGVTP